MPDFLLFDYLNHRFFSHSLIGISYNFKAEYAVQIAAMNNPMHKHTTVLVGVLG